jgi:hypothetical protein
MRILICHRPGGAFGYITDSWINALLDRGHIVVRWDGNKASWDKFNPDLYIGCSGHRQPIPTERKAKIAIHVNPYGPVEVKGINERQESIEWVLRQRPDVVFGYGFEDDRLLWDYWTSRHDIPWVPMPTAGDKVIYKMVVDPESRDTDVVYLGGKWDYKAETIDAFLTPVLEDTRISHKLYGWGSWSPGICSGILPEDRVTSFFNTGRVAPCIAEKHTHTSGIDVPERVFKVALCGALPIHDAVPALAKQIPNLPIAGTPAEYHSMCYEYSRDDSLRERTKLVNSIRNHILNNHTYHHRLSGLFKALDFDQQAVEML